VLGILDLFEVASISYRAVRAVFEFPVKRVSLMESSPIYLEDKNCELKTSTGFEGAIETTRWRIL